MDFRNNNELTVHLFLCPCSDTCIKSACLTISDLDPYKNVHSCSYLRPLLFSFLEFGMERYIAALTSRVSITRFTVSFLHIFSFMQISRYYSTIECYNIIILLSLSFQIHFKRERLPFWTKIFKKKVTKFDYSNSNN